MVELVLTDNKGASRGYRMNLTIIPVEVEFVYLSTDKLAELVKPGVRAKIVYTDRFGNVTVKFNAEMVTDYDWKKLITPETLDVYIEPSGNRSIDEPHFNLSKLNFTWEIKSFEVDTMKLHFSFGDPIWISRETDHDLVVIDFHKSLNVLKSKNLVPAFYQNGRKLQDGGFNERTSNNQAVYEKDWIIKAKIPKQVPPTKQWEYFVWWVDAIRISLLVTLACSLLMANSFSTSLWYCLAYLRYCQVTLHLPMLATPVTLNLLQFCATMLAFPRFDVFNWLWSRETHFNLFDFDEQYKLKAWIADQQEDIGYRTHNTMINLSTLAVVLFVYPCLWAIYWVFRGCLPFCVRRGLSRERTKKCKAFVDWLDKSLFYRWIFALFLFGFMEFVIAGFLGMYKPLDTYTNETVGNILAYIALCVPLIALPAVYILLHEDKDKYDEDKAMKKMLPKTHTHFSVRHKRLSGWFFYPIYMAHRFTYLMLIMVFTAPTA